MVIFLKVLSLLYCRTIHILVLNIIHIQCGCFIYKFYISAEILLLDDLKEKRRYWKLKEEALDRTLCRSRFGRGYGSVVRQTTEWVREILGLEYISVTIAGGLHPKQLEVIWQTDVCRHAFIYILYFIFYVLTHTHTIYFNIIHNLTRGFDSRWCHWNFSLT
jgi:hypothetical protein